MDQSVDLARRFEVMSMPTLILFSDGEPRVRLVGARSKAKVLEDLKAHL